MELNISNGCFIFGFWSKGIPGDPGMAAGFTSDSQSKGSDSASLEQGFQVKSALGKKARPGGWPVQRIQSMQPEDLAAWTYSSFLTSLGLLYLIVKLGRIITSPQWNYFEGKSAGEKHKTNCEIYTSTSIRKHSSLFNTTHKASHLFTSLPSFFPRLRPESLEAKSETGRLFEEEKRPRAGGETQRGWGSSLSLIPWGVLKWMLSQSHLQGGEGAAAGHQGDGRDTTSQAFPGATALSVKGISPVKGILVSCQRTTLPAVGEGCPSGQRRSGWEPMAGPIITFVTQKHMTWPTSLSHRLSVWNQILC